MLMSELGKSLKVSACVALVERLVKGSAVMCLPWLELPLVMPTRLEKGCRMGSLAMVQSHLLK